MIKLISLACAAALCLAATPASAKEGCGSGLHMNNKGHCAVNKKGHAGGHHGAKVCGAHYHMGSNGHCHHN